MTPSEFQEYSARGFTRIPVSREVLADLDTPLSIYLKLANGKYSYLFESVQGGEKWGRYSIIGLPAKTVIEAQGNQILVREHGREVSRETVSDPLTWIEQYRASLQVAEVSGLPRFCGGLVGYFAYDCVRSMEPRLRQPKQVDSLNTPDILLMLSEEVAVFDNLTGKITLIVYSQSGTPQAYEVARERLDTLCGKLRTGSVPYPQSATPSHINESDFVSGFTQQRFEDAVRKCKQYIIDGDVMQVVLSQRLSIDFSANPIDLYRALRSLNPSPYMYYLNLADFYIVGSSPEILVRLEDQTVTVRPIAGTRRRGHNEVEDQHLEQELLADPKEIAEHLMLIDLGRNDVGRVAITGTVKLTEKMAIERYSHVMHIVSNVVGELKPDVNAFGVLRAAFPAGTVSGAPKIRAMEIIDSLEPVKRGIYAGAVGYISWNGNMDTAIAIRTAVIKDNKLHIQAGAGIVYDSVPELEWQETMNKARAMFRAVAMAASGI